MISADALRMSDREIKILKQEVGAFNLQHNFQRDPTQNSLGKDAFLKLLTVQMSHQDPLAPMDNRDMIAQLAQFSSVEQMTEVNKNLDSMKTFYSSQTGYSMLGKSVEVMDEAGNRFLGPVEMVMENDTGVALAVRTDNGLDFTNRLISDKLTLFERYLKKWKINPDLIKPYTPKHNGKVERSHRKDNERFYRNRRFISLEDAKKQARIYLYEYNNFPIAPLNWKSPSECLRDYYNK